MKFFSVQLLLLLAFPFVVAAQAKMDTTSRPTYVTQRIVGEAPSINGTLDDAAWNQVTWSDGFTQFEPDDSQPASQSSRFKILYDNRYLYVAWRCFDQEPAKIDARLGRRDQFPGDWIEVNFDSFNDKRTGFSFTASASGVRNDEFISKDGEQWDSSWNPTWFMKSNLDSLGYTVEARIPFSQLRFGKADEQVWGLQSTRRLFRYQETSTWSPIKQAQQGWVSRFGTLRGITGVKPRKPLEIQPYLVGQLNTGGAFDENDPFDRQTTSRISGGLDARIGITNDIAVDLSINPDFGQVEADPGAINLDGFQIFFAEQRPFFVENRNIFDYQLTESNSGGNFTSDLLFYSRRIGGSPNRFIRENGAAGFYVDQPENSTILGATKVSGKTQSGLSLGLLTSFTEREVATTNLNGARATTSVEPFTAYSVGRAQQDFNDRNSSIGFMLTAVNRQLDAPELNFLHRSAYTGGVDLVHRWQDRAWYLRANVVMSQVKGSTEAITRTQTSFEHLFQRPDADHLEVDTTLTQLTGTSGAFAIGEAAGKWVFEVGTTWRSPELELNDIGFLLSSEEINAFASATRRWQKPFSIFRSLRWSHSISSQWDWSGVALARGYNTSAFTEFKNFWSMSLSMGFEQLDISKNFLRGGPLLRRPRGFGGGVEIGSDSRKKLTLGANFNGGRSYDGIVASANFGLPVAWQVSNAFSFSVRPSYGVSRREEQYFDQVETNGELLYLNGRIDRQTLSVTIRATVNLSPDFTIQYYGQPFIAKGNYRRFNRVGGNSLAKRFEDRYILFDREFVRYDADLDRYFIEANGQGIAAFSFANPDFNQVQFRSNFVARWEYRPGSELFFVWSQGLTKSAAPEQDVFSSLTDDLLGGDVRNTFLVKATYRWVR